MTPELNRIYCMDCLDGMRQMPDKSIDLVVTDPPYGIGEAAGKNKKRGGVAFKKIGGKNNYVGSRDYGNLEWDDKPPTAEYFAEIMRISKNQIIFGGNFFDLPPSPCWIVWDKDNGDNDFSDCELAWTTFKTAVRKFTWRWNGLLQEDMAHKEIRCHPTQKPVPLFEWIIGKYAKEGDTICDPFFGSGSCLVACVRMGHQFIGFEKEQSYYNAASIRIKKAQEQGKISGWFE
jgi:site-specific DNA-methyltransferase (adenine-specific)